MPDTEINFSDFAESPLQAGDYLVGYRTAASGGERRFPASSIATNRQMTPSFRSAPKTFTETPTAIFAGTEELSSRRWLIIRNEALSIRLRYGVLQANLQRDGEILEPGAVVMIELDPLTPTTIYACSEGRSITSIIGEDTQ